MTADKRILVVCYSLTGNTERVARDIAARLDADVERIQDKKNRQGLLAYLRAALDSGRERPAQIGDVGRYPNEYALTVIGTPVWAGKMTPAVRAYLRMAHGRFNDVAFFTTSGSTPAGKIVPAMEALAGRKAVAFTGFNGRELNSASLYDEKLSAFVRMLRNAGPSRISRDDSTAHSYA